MKTGILDKYYPIAGATIVATAYLIIFQYCPKFATSRGFRDLFVAAVTINAISVGFLVTAKSTLISISNSRVVKWLKETDSYTTTIHYFSDAVHWSFSSAIFSSILLLIDFQDPLRYTLACIAIWLFLITSALLSMYRVINLLTKILLRA